MRELVGDDGPESLRGCERWEVPEWSAVFYARPEESAEPAGGEVPPRRPRTFHVRPWIHELATIAIHVLVVVVLH
jgi:hypothetical protein